MLIELFIKTLAVTFGSKLAESVASKVVCAVSKCPAEIDKIAEKAKERQATKGKSKNGPSQ